MGRVRRPGLPVHAGVSPTRCLGGRPVANTYGGTGSSTVLLGMGAPSRVTVHCDLHLVVRSVGVLRRVERVRIRVDPTR